MAYQFAGFFARPAVPRPAALPEGAVWREIAAPFLGVGVRLPALLGEAPPADEVRGLARRLGLDAAECWLYLTYDCRGGDIDYVYGLGSRGGVPFGPVEEDVLGRVTAAYTGLMGRFGLPAPIALRFEPFTRAYWDE